ncbi:hypothetical protein VFPFJ_00379 [Purpureocillium lilacinum]|uniref:Uncharacterized protein n=1 Tax=Purpureocillium lilacinum TaxID=33203 RepID=A0A179H9K9_PURLI|nr:hypothetical protein VFPFJ_00379 [Purpureocillium lilacinum]OAQ86310.1 hypothetical protein VFPBJ_00350 [Purpureocillium lilacinum]OAQ94270.1 hypothetical protein VFPFJ_00379 [Purpureocillium lilacinum]
MDVCDRESVVAAASETECPVKRERGAVRGASGRAAGGGRVTGRQVGGQRAERVAQPSPAQPSHSLPSQLRPVQRRQRSKRSGTRPTRLGEARRGQAFFGRCVVLPEKLGTHTRGRTHTITHTGPHTKSGGGDGGGTHRQRTHTAPTHFYLQHPPKPVATGQSQPRQGGAPPTAVSQQPPHRQALRGMSVWMRRLHTLHLRSAAVHPRFPFRLGLPWLASLLLSLTRSL